MVRRITVTEKLTSHCIVGECHRPSMAHQGGEGRKWGWCKDWDGLSSYFLQLYQFLWLGGSTSGVENSFERFLQVRKVHTGDMRRALLWGGFSLSLVGTNHVLGVMTGSTICETLALRKIQFKEFLTNWKWFVNFKYASYCIPDKSWTRVSDHIGSEFYFATDDHGRPNQRGESGPDGRKIQF